MNQDEAKDYLKEMYEIFTQGCKNRMCLSRDCKNFFQ